MVDRYTKTVLTVIAAALCALVAQNAVGPLQAQQTPSAPGAVGSGIAGVQRVAICDTSGTRCAAIEAGLGVGRGADAAGSLRVLGEVRTLGR